MEVVIVDSPEEGSRLAAGAIAAAVEADPKMVLGLATGGTPLGVYDDLVRRHEEDGLSFANVTGFALDEYVGLPKGHPESYREVLLREFARRVDLPEDAVNTPDGWAEDLSAACADYDEQIRAAGGINIQILGVGTDGHIGFNEPTSSLESPTRLKTLTEQTREDNARFFDDDVAQVPKHVLTQGIGTIRRAGHLLLLAWGAQKAEAVAATVEGPVTSMVPSSALQLHPHATVIVDREAAGDLRLRDYYEDVYRNKPAWQGI